MEEALELLEQCDMHASRGMMVHFVLSVQAFGSDAVPAGNHGYAGGASGELSEADARSVFSQAQRGKNLCKKDGADVTQERTNGGTRMFLSSFAIGITNPAAILTFLFAFSDFGITSVAGLMDGVSLVCGVFAGTYLWWGLLTAATCAIKKKTGDQSVRIMNKVFGGILTLFGAVVFLRVVW